MMFGQPEANRNGETAPLPAVDDDSGRRGGRVAAVVDDPDREDAVAVGAVVGGGSRNESATTATTTTTTRSTEEEKVETVLVPDEVDDDYYDDYDCGEDCGEGATKDDEDEDDEDDDDGGLVDTEKEIAVNDAPQKSISSNSNGAASFVVGEVVGAMSLHCLLVAADGSNRRRLPKKTRPQAAANSSSSGGCDAISARCRIRTVERVRGPEPSAIATADVHRTATIHRDAHPIWTVRTRSLFLLEVATPTGGGGDDGGTSAFLAVEVEDSSRGLLGSVEIPLEEIRRTADDRDRSGERLEYPILPPPPPPPPSEPPTRGPTTQGSDHVGECSVRNSGECDRSAGSDSCGGGKARLALRFRRATAADLAFLKDKYYADGPLEQKKSAKEALKETVTSDYDEAMTIVKTSDSSRSIHLEDVPAIPLPPVSPPVATPAVDINFKDVQGSRKQILQEWTGGLLGSCSRRRADKETGETLHRVKPGPDPRRRDETKWMTSQQLRDENLRPSEKWVSVGGGRAGTVFLEILNCQNLPNLDDAVSVLGVPATAPSSVTRDYTDAFAAVAYEDNLVRTEVIWDDLKPMWMPWTARAFAFEAHHPSSMLQIGVFDHDSTPMKHHDPVGRVVISLSNFDCGTTYVLKYKLNHDPTKEEVEKEEDKGSNDAVFSPTSRGTITVRLRIEWKDRVNAVVKSLGPPPRFVVNVENKKSYSVLRYLTRGKIDTGQASLATIKMYLNELLSYWSNFCYLLDVVLGILLWRGRIAVSRERTVWFPIHSVALFVGVVLLIEYPQKAVSVFFYGIAWAMISVNWSLARNPSPWKRVKTFSQRSILAATGPGQGRMGNRPRAIEPYEGNDEQIRLEKLDQFRSARMSSLIQAFVNFALDAYSIYNKTSEGSTQVTRERKQRRGLLDHYLSNYYIYPHMLLMTMCMSVRIVLNVVNWKQSTSQSITVLSIWIATLWLVFPVNTVALWILRILAWSFLGPWMKVVDLRYFRPRYKSKAELLDELKSGRYPSIDLPDFDAFLESNIFVKMGHSGRVLAENALKLKDMRIFFYGEYGEVIPTVDSSRYSSVPYPESYAYPSETDSPCQAEEGEDSTALLSTSSTTKYDGTSCTPRQPCHHIPGQRLQGTMVMTLEDYHVWNTKGCQ